MASTDLFYDRMRDDLIEATDKLLNVRTTYAQTDEYDDILTYEEFTILGNAVEQILSVRKSARLRYYEE